MREARRSGIVDQLVFALLALSIRPDFVLRQARAASVIEDSTEVPRILLEPI